MSTNHEITEEEISFTIWQHITTYGEERALEGFLRNAEDDRSEGDYEGAAFNDRCAAVIRAEQARSN